MNGFLRLYTPWGWIFWHIPEAQDLVYKRRGVSSASNVVELNNVTGTHAVTIQHHGQEHSGVQPPDSYLSDVMFLYGPV